MNRTLPPFLKDGRTAFRWALKNVDDLKDYVNEMNERERGLGEEFYGGRALEYASFARGVYNDGSIQIYRAIRVPVGRGGNPKISFSQLGKAWSKERRGAGVYGNVHSTGGPTVDVVLTGVVEAQGIDWEYGFSSFLNYGEDQWEVSLLPNVPVLVTHIDDKELDQPILGNSGKAEETWTPISPQ